MVRVLTTLLLSEKPFTDDFERFYRFVAVSNEREIFGFFDIGRGTESGV